ncbi:glycosyltransferase, group 2 family protein [Leptospira fainei serovar Hurstbridge str. BUT 6]|uniref:Glycosyltransferase, group 2 family protein n=1 Tax=Leptospira fainei serovar Hurstbridge str. BUT 6 TaxID=1193011 RepID=S3V9V5_9LEPT|nr:glycosyltransferase family 2 protein [Leptospira fainei]EPG73220.1 glycosyltransferase, group 2 family protein [Leptospira fainei serovar Hurstbridge str. BUT 6]
MPLPISACIITLNEEDNITRCLSSLKFVDEIIVLDSGSSDRTGELAKSFGAKIVHREFDDYVSQKNHVVSLAKNSWILSVDADEEISPKLENEIREILGGREPEEDGFLIPRLTMYMGKWVRHGGWYPNYRVRLFKKSKGRFVGGKVHESVLLEGKKRKLKNPILHYSYQNLYDHVNFINRYSELAATEKFAKGKRTGLLFAFLKASYKSFWMYFVRCGFLDGRRGFILAIMGFYYNFLKYTKILEMSLAEKDRKRREN